MPPSFFALPPEVRNKIYEFLFVSDHPEKLITPDPDGSRHRSQLRRPNLSNCLPLLRTCQYVHEEAVSVLYGSNVFAFSDRPHGTDDMEVIGFDFSVQWCDFLTMYGFFSRIGRRNRPRIRHLRLHFSTLFFIYYLAEAECDQVVRYCGGANCIGEALELLSSNHNLQSFELVFGRKDNETPYIFYAMFRGETPFKLVRIMMQFKNVRRVKDVRLEQSHSMDTPDDWPLMVRDIDPTKYEGGPELRVLFGSSAYDRFLALRREMEAEEPDKREVEEQAVTHIKTAYGFRRNPIDQTKGAEERHDNQMRLR